jgi:hypothetical protein
MPYADKEKQKQYFKEYDRKRRLEQPALIKSRRDSYYARNKEKCVARMRAAFFKRSYGITPKDYECMFEQQQGKCGICKKTQKSGRRLAVDHCHITKKVRGLLCQACNSKVEKYENYLNSCPINLRDLTLSG